MSYTRTYDIPYFLVDKERKLRITALIQFMEDMAIRHSEACGVGLDFYEQQQVAWVLAKWDIEVTRSPRFNQQITIITEPTAFRNFFGFRKFVVKDHQGEVLAGAHSLWIFIDTRKKKPIPVNEKLIRAFGLTSEKKTPLPIEAPSAPETGQYATSFLIRPGDIDTNHHVNNARYIEWALDTLPIEVTTGKSVHRVLVDYRKELNYGQEITSEADIVEKDHTFLSRHRIGNDEKTACEITFKWM